MYGLKNCLFLKYFKINAAKQNKLVKLGVNKSLIGQFCGLSLVKIFNVQ